MAVTYGFYNSVNKDRAYNAIQMSQIFDGIINDGIYMSVLDHFAVTASGGMNISVGGGRAWFNHTWTYNDSSMLITIDESEFEANRIDAVVLKVDRRDSARKNEIVVIKGTPGDVPEKPVIEDGNDIYYHPLAYITINAGVTVITDANIENAIGVNPRTPFVTGIIEHIHAEDLIEQWGIEWNTWNQEHRDDFEAWVALQEQDMENWTSETKQSYNNWIAEQEASFEEWSNTQESSILSWMNTQKQLFLDWVATIHNILDEETAGHLQNEIESLQEDIQELKDRDIADWELENSTTTYTYDENGEIMQSISISDSMRRVVTYSDTKPFISSDVIEYDGYRYTKSFSYNEDTGVLTEMVVKEKITNE